MSRYEPWLLVAAIIAVLCVLAHAVARGGPPYLVCGCDARASRRVADERGKAPGVAHDRIRGRDNDATQTRPKLSAERPVRNCSGASRSRDGGRDRSCFKANDIFGVSHATSGRGDEAYSRGDSAEDLVLARALVAEAGLGCMKVRCAHNVALEHSAIAHALGRGARRRGVSLKIHIRQYCSAFKRSARGRIRWIMELEETGKRPLSFPSHLLWNSCNGKPCKSRKELWLNTLKRSRRYLSGQLKDPCGADHWGSRTHPRDVRRGQRAIREGRWELARCSKKTRNLFYRLIGKGDA